MDSSAGLRILTTKGFLFSQSKGLLHMNRNVALSYIPLTHFQFIYFFVSFVENSTAVETSGDFSRKKMAPKFRQKWFSIRVTVLA